MTRPRRASRLRSWTDYQTPFSAFIFRRNLPQYLTGPELHRVRGRIALRLQLGVSVSLSATERLRVFDHRFCQRTHSPNHASAANRQGACQFLSGFLGIHVSVFSIGFCDFAGACH